MNKQTKKKKKKRSEEWENKNEDSVTKSYIVERSRCEMKATTGQRTTKQREEEREEKKNKEMLAQYQPTPHSIRFLWSWKNWKWNHKNDVKWLWESERIESKWTWNVRCFELCLCGCVCQFYWTIAALMRFDSLLVFYVHSLPDECIYVYSSNSSKTKKTKKKNKEHSPTQNLGPFENVSLFCASHCDIVIYFSQFHIVYPISLVSLHPPSFSLIHFQKFLIFREFLLRSSAISIWIRVCVLKYKVKTGKVQWILSLFAEMHLCIQEQRTTDGNNVKDDWGTRQQKSYI